jgi:hypothetical protein
VRNRDVSAPILARRIVSRCSGGVGLHPRAVR